MRAKTGIRVLLYTQQPFVAVGVAKVLAAGEGFELVACCDELQSAVDYLQSHHPDLVLVHLTSRIGLAELGRLWPSGSHSQVILWGDAIGGEFAFQAMLLGARAILPSHTSIDGLLTSMRNVHRGVLCFEKDLVDNVMLQTRVSLTRREGQIVSLVAEGYKNKAIGSALGITEGTVKVYLYKLFKKLGVNDRLDMALYGLKNLFAGETVLAATPGPRRIEPATSETFGPRSLPPQLRDRTPSHRVN